MIVHYTAGREACVEDKGSMCGRRDMHGRKYIAVAIIGRMGEGTWKAPLLFYIYSCLYCQLDR